jgi:hypothetical protein
MTVGESKMKSNLIPITRIYDIYPKYTYSNDVKKFMDEIVDIDRANAFTKADIVDILDNIRAEIEGYKSTIDKSISEDELKIEGMKEAYTDLVNIIDKYKVEMRGNEDCLKALDEIDESGLNIYSPNEMSGRRLTYQQCLEFIDKYREGGEENDGFRSL